MFKISSEEQIKTKPNLSLIALLSFVVSFVTARIFTSLSPQTVFVISGFHIHHFWYGLAMLAVGGWLGISVENERINRIAAILFGAGGGLIGDEVGLLLTLSAHAYWAEFTYTIIIIFLAVASMSILLFRYGRAVRIEFAHFLRSNASLYIGVFLATISIAFLIDTEDMLIIIVSGGLTVFAFLIIVAYFMQHIRIKLSRA